jgi:L-iditol 2-dehydrogenase
MKAACLIGPSEIALRDVPDPLCPADGLLLRVVACGICGSDLRRWKEGPAVGSGVVVPGHEVAGVVEEVGAQCRGYAVGERLALAPDVHCGQCFFCQRGLYNICDDMRMLGITPGYPGGLAERMPLNGHILANGIVHRLPPELGLTAAALAEPCASVLAAHARAETGPADTVLILGAGPIGCLHTVVARARGARALVAAPSERSRERAKQFAPDAVLDPTAMDFVAQVRALAGGRGADIVIVANPAASSQTQAVEAVRKGGQVLLFGGLPKASPLVTLDANRIHYGEISVIGSFSYHPTMHELALELLARGVIPAAQLVTHTFSLAQVREAFAAAAGRDGLKVMVVT